MEELEPITPTEEMKSYLQHLENGVLDGELDALEVYVKVKHYQKLLAKLEKAIYGHAKDDAFRDYYEKTINIHGCEVQKKMGVPKPDYKEDTVYSNLEKDMKGMMAARKALLDAALKSKEPIFDNEGIEVPKVPYKGVADSLTVIPKS